MMCTCIAFSSVTVRGWGVRGCGRRGVQLGAWCTDENAAQRELKGGARAKQRGPGRVGTNFLYYILIFATFGVLRDAIVRQAIKSIDDTARE
jgi:hypothetical protein